MMMVMVVIVAVIMTMTVVMPMIMCAMMWPIPHFAGNFFAIFGSDD